ncbi:MAG TPA: chromate transporter [Anaerolineae bacterium]|nr:chromate transporter [Anaerolineae bacterium]
MLEYLALLLKLFLVFSKVGLLAWGGGPSMIPLMQQEVLAQGWLTPEGFIDALALGNALPGPIATKMSIYVGYEQAGILGAIAAVSGTIAPSGVLMLILAVFFLGQKTPLIDAALTAVRPAVIGLLIWTAYDLGEAVLRRGGITWGQALTTNWDKFLIAAAVALVMIRFGDRTEMAVLVIVGSAILGILVYR